MTTYPLTAVECLLNSQKAFQKGDLTQARNWAQQAARLEPQSEEAWLWMGAIATPQASVGYLKRALEINPASTRALQGLAWAQKRVLARQMAQTRPIKVHREMPAARPAAIPAPPAPESIGSLPTTAASPSSARPQPAASQKRAARNRRRSSLNLSAVFVALAVLFLGVGLIAMLNTSSARADLQGQATPTALPTDTAQADQSTAGAQATSSPANDAQAAATSTPLVVPSASPAPQDTATALPQATATALPQASPTPLPTDTAEPQSKPTKVAQAPAPQPEASSPTGSPGSGGPQRIVVSISKQHMWVYEGDTLVYSFVVSTGTHNSTAVGSFKVLDKIPKAYGSTWDLWMPDWLGIYYAGTLENGIHALPILSNGQTLWAGLLGQPASFGCIILSTANAKTLYDWAQVGTPVIIQS